MAVLFFAVWVLLLVSFQDVAATGSDTSDLNKWIVIQRRVSADVDFYRNWDDYKSGFGNFSGNFWLGNEVIHGLTFPRDYQLRVEFTFNNNSYFADYARFRVFGEDEKYRLEVSGYSGNAGDSLKLHNGRAFSTYDRDNDNHSQNNCAIGYHGAWWYKKCLDSNLNGLWGSTTFGKGVVWEATTGNYASATSTLMKVRAAP